MSNGVRNIVRPKRTSGMSDCMAPLLPCRGRMGIASVALCTLAMCTGGGEAGKLPLVDRRSLDPGRLRAREWAESPPLPRDGFARRGAASPLGIRAEAGPSSRGESAKWMLLDLQRSGQSQMAKLPGGTDRGGKRR